MIQDLIRQALTLDPDACIYDVRMYSETMMLIICWSWGLMNQYWYEPFDVLTRDFKEWTENVPLTEA